MTKKKFTNRKVDKVPLKKSKSQMWNFIKSQTLEKKADSKSTENSGNIWEELKSWLLVPARLASAGVVAAAMIFVLVFTSNFNGWFVSEEGLLGTSNVAHADFQMTATDESEDGVAQNSEFILASSEDLDVDEVKKNLIVEPEVEVKIEKKEDGIYSITPTQDLEGNKIYNFKIETEGKDFSWTYQVKDDFKVSSSLPANRATGVPTDTGIELYFSHEDFDLNEVKTKFSISPRVKGSFEKHRKVLSFVPKGGLKEATIYTVKLDAGLKLGRDLQRLEEDFVFQFETGSDAQTERDEISFSHDFYEVPTDSGLGLKAYTYNFEKTGKENFKLKLYKYSGLKEYEEALRKVESIPLWCYLSRNNYRHETDGLELIGSFDALVEKVDYTNYVYVPGLDLDEGYYLAETEVAGEAQALIQVTDISAYINVTETDTLVWLNDVKTGKAIAGAEVIADDVDSSTNTNKDGVAVFETPETWTMNEFYEREEKIITAKTSEGSALVTRVTPYGSDSIAESYWNHFETDRPVYKSDDVVRFWGFIAPRKGVEAVEKLEVKFEYGWNQFVNEMPVKINKDGSFVGRMPLRAYEPGYYSLKYFVNGEYMGSNSVQIENYTKPPYNLSAEADKNAYFTGETIKYNLATKFFDETAAPEIELEYYEKGEGYISSTTDKNGEAIVDKATDDLGCNESGYCNLSFAEYFSIRNKDTEVASIYVDTFVQIFTSKVGLITDSEKENGKAKVNVKAFNVDLSKVQDSEYNGYYAREDYQGSSVKGQKILGEIIENKWNKVEDGEYYDFVNKKVVKKYRYEKYSKTIEDFSINTDEDGMASYEFDYKEDHYYQVKFTTTDPDGRLHKASTWVYGGNARSQDYEYLKVEILNGEKEDEDAVPFYFYNAQNTFFKPGETVETALYNNETEIETKEGDRFVFMHLANGLKEYAVKDDSRYSFEFSDEHIPNVNLGAVWFDGQRYRTFSKASAKINELSKELSIEVIGTDKKLAPGEESEIKVKVKHDGKAVNDAVVQFSLVDESYFKLFRDSFDNPLDSLYTNLGTGEMAKYESHDNALFSTQEADGGMGGCFTADTKILMADGSYKKIIDIRPGDKVLTKKYEFSRELVEANVVAKMEHLVDGYLIVNGNLEVTAEHTMFVNGKWDVAGNLKTGDLLVNKDGELVEVESIELKPGEVEVYNFEVEGLHTYFANDIYVHNDKGGSPEVRSNFKDTALFRMVKTDAQGEASVSFTLPDNITSWRTAVAAIDPSELTAGIGMSEVVVTQPFFTELVLNDEYSVKDTPIIQMHSFGNDLAEGDSVEYQVESASLELEKSEVISGEAFKKSDFEVNGLSVGQHDLTVYSKSGDLEDNLRKNFDVVGSRLNETQVINFFDLEGDAKMKDGRNNPFKFELPGEGNSFIRLIDGGVGRFYSDLWSMQFSSGERLDQRLSKIIANELLEKYFGEENSDEDTDLALNYQDGGLKLLPYGSPDLRLTANILLMDSESVRFDQFKLVEYLNSVYRNPESNLDEIVYALSGLAALNEPVLLSLRGLLDEESLSLQEKMYIALAFDALGAKEDAQKIFDEKYNELVENTENNEGVITTALSSVLAGSLGEIEKSELLWEFVELIGLKSDDYSLNEDLINIYKIGRVAKTLPNVSTKKVRFIMEKNGDTEDIELDNWESFGVLANADDDLSVEVLKGEMDAILVYEKEVSPNEFSTDDSISIDRKYSVDGQETTNFAVGDIVEVKIAIDYAGNLKNKGFIVSDILPSGLKPVTGWRQYREKENSYGKRFNHPYRIDGQEVVFYWNANYSGEITYLARVASKGEYYSDPAKVVHYQDESVANISDAEVVRIEE